MNDPIVIVSAARTPMGAFQGELKQFAAAELGAAAIRAAVERAKIKPEQVDEVIMGCVLPAGQGQAPARQASLGAGLPLSAGCTTINKMCGSGMKAAMLAHDLLAAGTNDIMVAGGMESMTNAPYLLAKARGGYRLGHGPLLDHGPTLMRGYRLDPEASVSAFEPGGWLRTGDGGEVDPDGTVRVFGRLADVIVSGGEKIWPADVEAALASHPDVAA